MNKQTFENVEKNENIYKYNANKYFLLEKITKKHKKK